MGALQLPGQELQADAVGAQLLGERRQLDAAAEPLVLVTTIVTEIPDARISLARATAPSSQGGLRARVEIFSAKIRVTPEARSASTWGSSDWRAAEAPGVPDPHMPRRRGPGRRSGGTGTARAFARRGTSRNRAV